MNQILTWPLKINIDFKILFKLGTLFPSFLILLRCGESFGEHAS